MVSCSQLDAAKENLRKLENQFAAEGEPVDPREIRHKWELHIEWIRRLQDDVLKLNAALWELAPEVAQKFQLHQEPPF